MTSGMGAGTIIIALFICFVVYRCSSGSYRLAKPASTDEGAVGATASKPQWAYSKSDDKMTGKSTYTAAIDTARSLNLEFPYHGKNHGELRIFKHEDDFSVMVSIEKGQILCDISDCRVSVRFDDDEPLSFAAVRSASYDSTIIFIREEEKFMRRAIKAKRVMVELRLYKVGMEVLEFDATGLAFRPECEDLLHLPVAPLRSRKTPSSAKVAALHHDCENVFANNKAAQ